MFHSIVKRGPAAPNQRTYHHMPAFNPDTPRLARKFQGIAISVPAIFSEGHVCTANEAKWMNAQAATSLGNAFGNLVHEAVLEANKSLKKGQDPVTPAALGWDFQAEFDKLFTAREFGVTTRGGGAKGPSGDPIETLARTLATIDFKARVTAKGHSVNALMKAKEANGKSVYMNRFEQFYEANGATFRAQAEAQLASSTDSGVTDTLADLPVAA